MNPTSSRGCHPARSLAVGLFALLLWKSAYHAVETGYLTWFSALLFVSIVAAGAATVVVGQWVTKSTRAYFEHAQLQGSSALASKV